MILQDNIFLRPFHALELYQWFGKHFPGSFEIQIEKDPEPRDVPKRVWDSYIQRSKPGSFGKVKFPATYRLSKAPDIRVSCDEKVHYVTIALYDHKKNGHEKNGYKLHWGYKRSEVEEDYWTSLMKLICDTYTQVAKNKSNKIPK